MMSGVFTAIGTMLATFAITLTVIGCSTAMAGSEERISVEFNNRTDATIRVDTIDHSHEKTNETAIIAPNGKATLIVPAGKQSFDLIAFRANPARIHRVEVDVAPQSENSFFIIPHIMGLYILEDAGSLDALAAIPSETELNIVASQQLQGISSHCSSSPDETTGVVIWDNADPSSSNHFHKVGNYICAVDGSEAFYAGVIYNHFICQVRWQDCRRHPKGDAMLAPTVRTSGVFDTALRTARMHQPKADFTQTQTIEWLSENRTPSRLTTYFDYIKTHTLTECPAGFRLHYQGFCINIEDEMEDDPKMGVRITEPVGD